MKIFFAQTEKMSHFCAAMQEQKKFISHLEALEDLAQFLKERDGSVPVEVNNARYRGQGRVKRNGRPIGLGPAHVWKLLERHAPGRYDRIDIFVLK